MGHVKISPAKKKKTENCGLVVYDIAFLDKL
jgi:hypothetical protein